MGNLTQENKIILSTECEEVTEFLFLLSHMKLANAGRINPDFETGRGDRSPFLLPLAERAVLIGSTAHDSAFRKKLFYHTADWGRGGGGIER